jgi:hypothetical protein
MRGNMSQVIGGVKVMVEVQSSYFLVYFDPYPPSPCQGEEKGGGNVFYYNTAKINGIATLRSQLKENYKLFSPKT